MTKIIDIVPPNTSKNDEVKIVKKEKVKKRKNFPKVLALILFFVIAGTVLAFLIEGKGNVVIYPATKDIGLEEVIYISAQETSIDFEKNIIPGEYFEEKLDFEDTYEATGSDESAER